MTKDEVLKLALEALNSGEDMQIGRVVWTEYDSSLVKETITAIKETLAQPEQEPVAWHTEDHLTDRTATTYSKDMVYHWQGKGWPITPLYTTPPQRPWVGLTDDELLDIADLAYANDLELMHQVQAKLKEKNQ